jgi:ABC-2 type transport system permease protein
VNAALEVELLKAHRAPVFRWGALAVVFGVPAVTAAFFWLADRDSASSAGAKASAMITDVSMSGYVGYCGQILTIALLLSGGIVASWSFGREFVDGTASGLFAVATPLSRVAAAKTAVLLGWGATVVSATVLVVVAVGLVLDLGPIGPDGWAAAGRAFVGGLLVVALCVPFGLVASWRRGYLAGFVALLLVVVAAQIVTTAGAGAWFPYAAPSLWLGMGGPNAADAITTVHLLLPPALGALGGCALVAWWARTEAI